MFKLGYIFSGAVFEKFPAIPRMPKKHRGFHRGTLYRLGSSLSHSLRIWRVPSGPIAGTSLG
jgi:hypothetical protein